MRIVLSVFALLLFMSTSSLDANAEINNKIDCYEFAFDQMEQADDAGLDSETVSLIGEMAYCICAPNCEW